MKTPRTITLFTIFGLLAASSAAAAEPRCADAVIADWADGPIDGTYPPRCYKDALDALPEDVRNYSTAVDEIGQALRARIRAEARAAVAETDRSRRLNVRAVSRPTEDAALSASAFSRLVDSLPVPLLSAAAVVLALVLGLAASTSSIARRLRRGQC